MMSSLSCPQKVWKKFPPARRDTSWSSNALEGSVSAVTWNSPPNPPDAKWLEYSAVFHCTAMVPVADAALAVPASGPPEATIAPSAIVTPKRTELRIEHPSSWLASDIHAG